MAAASRARKRRRLWLALPFAAALLALFAMAAGWGVLSGRVRQALAEAPARAAAAGVQLTLTGARVDGFPFRLRVSAGPVRLAFRSGWAVEAPALTAQAFTYAPGHWVLIAPAGLTVVRPQGGPLTLTGAALRASVAGVDRRPWRVVLAGDEVRFTTPAGARPFSLASAKRIGLYLQPGAAAGEGAVLLDLASARSTPGTAGATVANSGAVDAAVEGRLTKLDGFSGADWGAAVRSWREAGGALAVGRAELRTAASELWARGGEVRVGPDGRLAGEVPLRLNLSPGRGAARELGSLPFKLKVKDGEVRLGPLKLGPPPKVG